MTDTLTCQEAAALRGVNINTVRAAIQKGRLPATKRDGKSYALRREDVLAWEIVGHRPRKRRRRMAWHTDE